MLKYFAGSMIGLDVVHGQVLSGDQLETMTETQLDQVIDNVSVFYRVTPRHKLAIVKVSMKKTKIRKTPMIEVDTRVRVAL